MTKQYLTAKDVSEVLGVSESKSYSIIRELNAELKSRGFITIPGKVSARFFREKCYGVQVE